MWPDAGLLGVIGFILLIGLVTVLFCAVWDAVAGICEQRAETRRQRIEAELDRKQEELRRTVLALASALAEERVAALDASHQMVARAYLTTGRVP